MAAARSLWGDGMNTKDGSLKILKSGDDAPAGHVLLNHHEYRLLNAIPEENRPEELAVMRFKDERRAIGVICTPQIENAFRLGFRKCIQMISQAEQAKIGRTAP